MDWDALYNRQMDAEYKPAIPEEQKEQEQQLLISKAPETSKSNAAQTGATE